jgi:hypothetical protein
MPNGGSPSLLANSMTKLMKQNRQKRTKQQCLHHGTIHCSYSPFLFHSRPMNIITRFPTYPPDTLSHPASMPLSGPSPNITNYINKTTTEITIPMTNNMAMTITAPQLPPSIDYKKPFTLMLADSDTQIMMTNSYPLLTPNLLTIIKNRGKPSTSPSAKLFYL